jgi:hypothetical protein
MQRRGDDFGHDLGRSDRAARNLRGEQPVPVRSESSRYPLVIWDLLDGYSHFHLRPGSGARRDGCALA